MIFVLLFLIAPSAIADNKIDSNDILLEEGGVTITKRDADLMFEEMDWKQKNLILSRKEKLKNLLTDALILRKRAKLAKQKSLGESDLFKWKLEKFKAGLLVQELIADYKKNITLPQNFEALAKDYYLSHPEEYTIPEKVNVAHILFEVKPDLSEEEKQKIKEKANDVLKGLKEGDDFSEAVKKYSADIGSVKTGGELGYFTKGKMVPAFEKAAFSLPEKDNLSNLVETRFGYHILKLIDRVKESMVPFEEVKKKLIDEEKTKFISSKVEQYLHSLSVSKSTNFYVSPFEQFYKDKKAEILGNQ